jgi:hypothetical protein
MPATLGPVVAMAVLAQMGGAVSGPVLHQEGEPTQLRSESTRTGKERLGGKSTDEQRIDNCNVPPELRGPKPRPDNCIDEARTTSKR